MSRRKLSSEERELWNKVARTARPLPGKKLEKPAAVEESFSDLINDMSSPQKKRTTRETTVSPLALPKKQQQNQQKHHPLERPVKRKIARGRISIDAKIDLHGLFQDEAHALLYAFLTRSHSRGHRHVLVITGKGTSLGSEGVLKRSVPLWFSLPEFRPLISSYETAARHHGGEGALYVRLARKNRPQ
ncbi:Smr/MutS family protein [Martelella mediterranea]|uniref:DNA-nicking Smr family endonuclease n=1 Tax=Martelella mediterranea TaxID=293089 RepID=A0A4R3NY09_9HYPH|nr:Smr/MutS family protein [Martelella mediterranea]TCT44670.1 DNA-nicking Smr family endonuclease [Martelella mediterranea]